MSKIRVRIPPSPTGLLHIGTARTALFNYLFAKQQGGSLVLRIEDTDLERSDKRFETDIIDGLKWLGLTWDEGPDVGGDYGPYRQTERGDTYAVALEKLHNDGHLYPCFCTEGELASQREVALAEGKPSVYVGTCRALAPEVAQERIAAGEAHTFRFKNPGTVVEFEDLVRGAVSFDASLFGDFIVAKSLKTPLYNLAVVIDDATMDISHVLRGDDHIANTPKQILLLEALGYTRPVYGHFPLILNADKSKLSKRKNKVSVLDYKNEGYLPEAMLNFMALLGWNAGDDRELYSLDELVKAFSVERIHKGGAVFDIEKLTWMNGHYVSEAELLRVVYFVLPKLIEKGYIECGNDDILKATSFTTKEGREVSREAIDTMIDLERGRAQVLGEISEQLAFYFANKPLEDAGLLLWKDMTVEDASRGLELAQETLLGLEDAQYTPEALEEHLKASIASQELKNGFVLWPLRVALTGLTKSTSPFDVASILGKQEALRRVQLALDLL